MTEGHFRLHGIYSSRAGPCSASLSTPLPRSTRPPNVRLKPNMTGNGLIHTKKNKTKTTTTTTTKQTNNKIQFFELIYIILKNLFTQQQWEREYEPNSGLSGIRAHDLCSAGAVLYQPSYQANGKLIISRVKFCYINSG